MDWNPDPRWPEHIVDLAKRIADDWEDVYDQLHDALLEEGFSENAVKDMICSRQLGSFKGLAGRQTCTYGLGVGIILNDGFIVGLSIFGIVDKYLKSRSLTVV